MSKIYTWDEITEGQADASQTWDVIWEPVGSPSLITLGFVRADAVSVGPLNGKPYTTVLDIPRILAIRFGMKPEDCKIERLARSDA